ncbi:MFS transporter [Bacillus sp. FJAT-42376]|uniref:MFS transporter n=1 Tax=Bacillus sp. FJAT-42376 TaxID=2014076 RepID=UPI0013DDD88C|nr:MFS transporter [Bacillus sp. FJAT-42376]
MSATRSAGIFFLLTAVAVASNLYLLIPIYSEVADGVGGKPEDIVWSASLFTVTYAVGLLSFGPISCFFGRKRTMAAAMLLCAVLAFFLSASSSAGWFQILRGIQGFFLAGFAPVAYSYCFEVFTEESRTHMISLINGGFLIAGVAGQIISSAVTGYAGWYAVFLCFGCIFLLIVLAAVRLLPSPKSADRPHLDFSVLLERRLLVCYVLTFFLLMSFTAFYDSFNRQFADAGASVLFYCRALGLLGVMLSFWSRPIIRRFGSTPVLFASLGTAAAALFISAAVPFLSAVTVISICFTAAMALLLPALILLIGEQAGEKRASAIPFYSFLLLAGASAGPILAYQFSFSLLLTGFSVLFAALGFLIRRQMMKKDEKNPES